VSVFEAELMGLILAMEFAVSRQWTRLWIECDSSSVVHAFKNPSVIPIFFGTGGIIVCFVVCWLFVLTLLLC